MAPIGKRDEHIDDSEPQNTSRFAGINLTGWAGIESSVMKHDSATMKDYADDIDTLLVFAALFSAILTTFVVQTYQLLQPGGNDTTNQLIAYQIFSQATHPNMPPAINATISGLLATSSFTPSSSARWINGLFFFSLVISLVAALFGIMARQWIREYLKWNAPLADPRENVLVRQIRFESWEAWNVETFIWSIPVLQELAMVLFLIGVVVLIWTLDDAVAIAVTILVVVFLTIILVITVLPVFVRRCPYRSPTAWACVRLVDFVLYISRLSFSWMSYSGRYIRYIALLISDRILRSQYIPRRIRRLHHDDVSKPRSFFYTIFLLGKTWRGDDMDFRGLFDWEDAALQLAREATHLGPDGTFVSEPDANSVSCKDCFYKNLTQSPVLLRALEWVSLASPGDSQITACIDQCMTSVHPDLSSSWSPCTQPVCQGVALTYLYPSQTSEANSSNGYTCYDVVLQAGWLDAHTTRNLPQADPITCHRISLGVIAQLPSDKMQQVTFSLNPKFSLQWSYWYYGDFKGLRLRLLAADLARATAVKSGSSLDWIRDDSSLRRVFEWLSMMTACSGSDRSLRLRADHNLDGLRAILDDEPDHKTLLCSRAPGLRTLAFILASRHAKVSITGNKSLALSLGSTELAESETLLLEYFSHEPSQWIEDDLNIIFFIGWRWITRANVGSSLADDKNIKIVEMIQTALEASLARNFNPCRFLWYADEMPPFFATVCSTEPGTGWLSPRCISVFTSLLHVIETYYKKGLCYLNQEQLHKSLEVAHSKDYTSCSLDACPWIYHSCDDVRTCLLLDKGLRTESPLETQQTPAPGPSHSNGELTSPTNGEAAVHEPFLNRCKIFGHKCLRFAKPADEESGQFSRSARAPDTVATASGDMSDGGIVVSPKRRMFSALTSEESAKVTGVEADGLPLVSLDSGRSHTLSADGQYIAAEAGLARDDQHTPQVSSRSSAYITETVDAIVSDVEPHADEASSRGDSDGTINSRLINSCRDVEHPIVSVTSPST